MSEKPLHSLRRAVSFMIPVLFASDRIGFIGDFFHERIYTSEYPQCRDVSWNVLKKTGSWYMPHGFMIRGCKHHSVCTTNRVFEDVPRNVPTWVDVFLVVVFDIRTGLHPQCWDVSPERIQKNETRVLLQRIPRFLGQTP
jgi:hypothetical protein